MMKIEIKNTRLLFLYRSIFFKLNFIHFYTDDKNLKSIVEALNIKKRRKRIIYVYEDAIRFLNNYYKDDICDFKGNKCFVQRKIKSNWINGCCMMCPLVTDKGCPSSNITCKLIYCKEAKKKIKTLKVWDIKILKCLSPVQRFMILAATFSSKEEAINDAYYGPIYGMLRNFKRQLKVDINRIHNSKRRVK